MRKLSLSFISMLVCIAIITAVVVVVLASVQDYGSRYEGRRLEEVRETVLSYIAQCYALEGAYPPDLQYLEDNYGMIMDKSRYIYHYEVFASNMFPDVKVLRLKGADD